MTAEREMDNVQQAQPAAEEEKRSLVDFPTSKDGLKDFLTAASHTDSKSEKPEDKSCALGLYLEPGTTVDVDKDCNFKVRPMTPEERVADEKRREYYKSPQYKKDQEEILRRLQ